MRAVCKRRMSKEVESFSFTNSIRGKKGGGNSQLGREREKKEEKKRRGK